MQGLINYTGALNRSTKGSISQLNKGHGSRGASRGIGMPLARAENELWRPTKRTRPTQVGLEEELSDASA